MGGFINHSETPNCEKIMHDEVGVMWLRATRDIKEGEELTIKYTLYNL
jgi:SET domain-containing protein